MSPLTTIKAVFNAPRTLAVAAAMVALPAVASARLHLPRLPVPVVDVTVGPAVRPPAPVVAVGAPAPVWVEPVYRTVADRQWVAPVVQAVHTQVLVPEQYGWRTVTAFDAYGRPFAARQRVLVVPAHYEDQVQQQVVTPGYWTAVERQELVAPGYWAQPAAVVVPVAPPRPHGGIHIRL